MKFFEGGYLPLVASVVTHSRPIYVQFYLTARCNLRCVQCNVIYSNGDQEECTLTQIREIAKNLKRIGTSIVLLTGGEPFARVDLPEIVSAFVEAGIHPRLQTNGFATLDALKSVVAAGARDISISLDSLVPSTQDSINGGFDGTWGDALETVARVNQTFPTDSFCAFGTVLSPMNFQEIPSIVKFATEIGWWVSLVPAHQSPPHEPRSFATYDVSLRFERNDFNGLREVIKEVKDLRKSGFNLYDSDEYLDDIVRYVTGDPIRWRRRNEGLCDSPNLYFAIQPNGRMAVCCDYRLDTSFSVFDSEFPDRYLNEEMFDEAREIARRCSGCMYGSFPEITISARYLRPMIDRLRLFSAPNTNRHRPMSRAEIESIAAGFRTVGA